MSKYEVFLSHNSTDKPFVEEIASTLERAGLTPYLDKWHLIPGEPWQESLELAIDESKTCAVFIGPTGIGPWHNEEMRVFLEKRLNDKSMRVIPVLLPGVDRNKVSLPAFLSRLHYVDFSPGIASVDGFTSLISGITGVSPKATELPFSYTEPKVSKKFCVVLSGPSSVGKDVVLGRLMEMAKQAGYFPELLQKYTTRDLRVPEREGVPFIYLTQDEFQNKVSENTIGCVRYSYNNYYGMDQTFSNDLNHGELLFVSYRLYQEIDIFKHAASLKNVSVISVLLTSDVESLKARITQRSLDDEQKTERTAQIVEDIKFLSGDENELKTKFDMVIDNSDHTRLYDTVNEIWSNLENRLKNSNQVRRPIN